MIILCATRTANNAPAPSVDLHRGSGHRGASLSPVFNLVDPRKVLLPPLHIKLGLMKLFVKALDKDESWSV